MPSGEPTGYGVRAAGMVRGRDEVESLAGGDGCLAGSGRIQYEQARESGIARELPNWLGDGHLRRTVPFGSASFLPPFLGGIPVFAGKEAGMGTERGRVTS